MLECPAALEAAPPTYGQADQAATQQHKAGRFRHDGLSDAHVVNQYETVGRELVEIKELERGNGIVVEFRLRLYLVAQGTVRSLPGEHSMPFLRFVEKFSLHEYA